MAKSDEKIVRLSNSIAFVTAKKMEVAKLHYNIEELLAEVRTTKNARKRIQKDLGVR